MDIIICRLPSFLRHHHDVTYHYIDSAATLKCILSMINGFSIIQGHCVNIKENDERSFKMQCAMNIYILKKTCCSADLVTYKHTSRRHCRFFCREHWLVSCENSSAQNSGNLVKTEIIEIQPPNLQMRQIGNCYISSN